jgi:hypothetical protein
MSQTGLTRQGVRTEQEVTAERIGLRLARGDFAQVDRSRADVLVASDLRCGRDEFFSNSIPDPCASRCPTQRTVGHVIH